MISIEKAYKYMVKSYLGDVMSDIYIYNCEIEKCDKNKETTDLIMPHTALHYIVEGYGYFNGVRLGKGDYFCAVKNEKVCYFPEKENPWTYIYVDLIGKSHDEIIKKYNFKGINSYGKVNFLDEVFEIKKLFEIHSQKNTSNKTFFNSLAVLLLSLHSDPPSTAENLSITDIHVKKIKEYIDYNFNKKILMEDVAKKHYLSTEYMRNIFYDSMGISPKKYLQKIRMEKAADLLKHTYYKINEIAVSVGYDDQLAFSKVFKSYFGLSPKNLRDLKKNSKQ